MSKYSANSYGCGRTRMASTSSFALVPDPGLDHVLGEHVAVQQELVVLLQRGQRLVERLRRLRHVLQLLRRQVVDVLVERRRRGASCSGCRRASPSASPANARYGLPRRPGSGTRAASPSARDEYTGMRIAAERLPLAVGQVHRRLVARHQALVAVRRRVGDRAQGRGVLAAGRRWRTWPCRTGRRSRCRRRGSSPSFHSETWTCMPLPLSSNSGLGMNVAVLPCRRATFLTMYLYFSTLSAIATSVVVAACRSRTGRRWPPRGGGSRPSCRTRIIVSIISVRRSCSASVGGHGK